MRTEHVTLGRNLPAGLLVGGAASLFWAFIYAVPVLGLPKAMERYAVIFVLATTLGAWLAVGAAFGLLARRRLGRCSSLRVAIAGGVTFVVASFVGMVGAGLVEGLAVGEGGVDRRLLPIVFAAAFAGYLAGVVAALTLAVGLVLRVPGILRCALLAGAVTAAGYLVIALALNLLPGWRVGGGEGAMIKVALVANLLTGIVGGTTSMLLLAPGAPTGRTRRSSPPEATTPGRRLGNNVAARG